MDHHEGLELNRVVQQQGPLAIHQAVEYVIQAARVLEVAHANGIIYRDIRPSKLMLDSNGTVRVLGLGLTEVVEANDCSTKADASLLTQASTDIATISYKAPEHSENSQQGDHRADIFSLGCTLFYLLTGRAPFPGETVPQRVMDHEAPSIRAVRPEVPPALEAAYKKMVAWRPEDRPSSMTDVITLLIASTGKGTATDNAGEVASKPKPQPKIASATRDQRPGVARPHEDPSSFVRREEREGLLVNPDWNLEDLVLDRRPGDPPGVRKSHEDQSRRLKRTRSQGLSQRSRIALVVVGAIALIMAAFVGVKVSWRTAAVTENPSSEPSLNSDERRNAQTVESSLPEAVEETRNIFDGTSGQGWMLCNRTPLPPENVQLNGLNPHSTGSYLVVYEHKVGDFVLDFDYKLSKGCNSGVFLRVGDLNNPIETGIEVSIDDMRWDDDRDSGGFCGLIAPSAHVQKPSGQWNHMTITAQGSRLAVSLNDLEVSSIDLDLWTLPGKSPDGSIHQFKKRAIAHMARAGYLGFQDLGGDCWFKNIVLKSYLVGRRSAPTSS